MSLITDDTLFKIGARLEPKAAINRLQAAALEALSEMTKRMVHWKYLQREAQATTGLVRALATAQTMVDEIANCCESIRSVDAWPYALDHAVTLTAHCELYCQQELAKVDRKYARALKLERLLVSRWLSLAGRLVPVVAEEFHQAVQSCRLVLGAVAGKGAVSWEPGAMLKHKDDIELLISCSEQLTVQHGLLAPTVSLVTEGATLTWINNFRTVVTFSAHTRCLADRLRDVLSAESGSNLPN